MFRRLLIGGSIWKTALIGAGALFGLGAVTIIGGYIWLSSGLQSVEDLANYEPPVTSRVYAGDGKLIGEYASEHRVFVPSEDIPKQLINAFTSAEDKTFFEHHGIDYMGLIRGTVGNTLQGRRMAGGSTITQQVAKNMLLKDNSYSALRKAKEAVLATRVEKAFSKEEIIELYMNEIYLGHGAWGVGAAALLYFDKSLKDLSLSECAAMAALPQRPATVNPIDGPRALEERRNWVLDRMAVNGHISKAEAEKAKAEKLVVPTHTNADIVAASGYFVEEVRREGIDREIVRMAAASGKLPKETTLKDYRGLAQNQRTELRKQFEANAMKAFYEGGLSIRTTLDTRMQINAQAALRAGLETYDRYYSGWRGPVTHFDSVENYAKQISKYATNPANKKVMGGIGPDWRMGVILGTDGNYRLGLSSGEEGTLTPEDAKTMRAWKNADKKGVSIGDVILISHNASPDNTKQTILDYADAPKKQYSDKAPYRLRQMPQVEGAFVALDPHTGRILAMQGGYAYERSEFNRVMQAKRQPGSSFKPFVYAAALDAKGPDGKYKYTPGSRVLDGPYSDCSDLTQKDCYMPGNYEKDFYGLATLRLGVERSRNTMTVRLASDIGLPKVSEMGERMGIYDSLPPYTAMALGAGETTPIRMATGYAELVNGGKKIEPYILDRMQDRYGRTVYRRDTRSCLNCNVAWAEGMTPPQLTEERQQVIDPLTAYQMVSILEGVVERGTAAELKKVHKPLGAKTGTSNDEKDAWLMAFSPDLVVGVWFGFDNAKPMGRGATGGRMAAPIVRDFLLATLKDQPPTPFRRPRDISIVDINADSGCRPFGDSRDRLVIEEAFKPETEPKETCDVGGTEGGAYKVDFGKVIDGDEGRAVGTQTPPVDPNAPPVDPNAPPVVPTPTPSDNSDPFGVR